jgi:hypothetical protein
MAPTTHTSSTEPLRAPEPTHQQPEHITLVEPTQPPTHPTLEIPGVAVDGASEERNGGATTSRPITPTPSANPSANASALYPHTQVVFEDPDFTRPPPLNYSLQPRKKAIFWFWFLIFLDCVCMPIGLYFGMWYGLTRDQLSANAVFSISTALLGTVSIVEYFLRFSRLWRKNSNCRVIGAQRHYVSFDFFRPIYEQMR